MNTIVMNTLTGAVTEYDWAFQSITPTHAGSATGLFLLGGDKDGALPIPADVLTGKQLMDAAQKKRIPDIYYAVESEPGSLSCVVATEDEEYEYDFAVRAGGVSRANPGKGIRESYLQVGLKSTGDDFTLDYIEANVAVTSRRI